MVCDAAATKAPIARIADRVSGIFVPLVIGIALLTAAGWMLVGEGLGVALTRAVAVLVVARQNSNNAFGFWHTTVCNNSHCIAT